MDPIPSLTVIVYSAQLMGGMALITWAVLWAVRSTAVNLWVLGGLGGAVFPLLTIWAWPRQVLPPWILFPIVATVGLGASLCRPLALRRLQGPWTPGRAVGLVLAANVLVSVAFGLLGARGRMWFSWYLLLALVPPIGLAAWWALALGRRMGIVNAKLLAATTGLAAFAGLASVVAGIAERRDLLAAQDTMVAWPAFATASFIGMCNSALFIGVVLDLMGRRVAESQRAVAEMEERSRLVADLHDGFGTQLTMARMSLEAEPMGQARVAEILGECHDDLRLVVDTLRHGDGSLAHALYDYRYRCDRRLKRNQTALEWKLDVDGAPPMPQRTILQVLRVVQEALGNALQHAEAGHIAIEVDCPANGPLSVVVRDDGLGLPLTGRGGSGIGTMRARAQSLGGTFSIERREPGPGTLMTLVVPVAGRAEVTDGGRRARLDS